MRGASVVVCSHNQSPRLRLVLRALSAQSTKPLEVIVADDGSTDGTGALLEEAKGWMGTELIVLGSRTNRGAPATRNAGAARARGDVLVFLDGDAVPTHGHVGEHVALQRALPSAAFGPLWHTPTTEYLRDPIRGEPFDLMLPAHLEKQLREAKDTLVVGEQDVVQCFEQFAARARPGTYPTLGWAEEEGRRLGTAHGHHAAWVLMSPQNLSLPRSVFEAIGGFDESLPFSEGWDLMLRAGDAGLVTARVANAPIYHLYHHRPLGSFEQGLLRWSAMVAIAHKRRDPAVLLALLFYAAHSEASLVPVEIDLDDADALAEAFSRVRRDGLGVYGRLLLGHPRFSEFNREIPMGIPGESSAGSLEWSPKKEVHHPPGDERSNDRSGLNAVSP
jgi:GT2 family glycosyltransferase